MAQQTAERRIYDQSFQGGHPTRTTHGPFLVTGESSSGSSAAFEPTWMGGDRLMAPARSHKHHEERLERPNSFKQTDLAFDTRLWTASRRFG